MTSLKFLVKPMINVLGIDPDMRKPGICSMGDWGFDFASWSLCELMYHIRLLANEGDYFAIEDVNQIKTLYAKNRRSNVAVQTKIAQKVGMVKAAGTILIDYIEHHGGKVILVPPGIGRQTKNDAKLFAELTGYTGRTNEDTRDAYWIAKYAYEKLKANEPEDL